MIELKRHLFFVRTVTVNEVISELRLKLLMLKGRKLLQSERTAVVLRRHAWVVKSCQ